MKTVLPLLGEYLGTFLLTLTILTSTNPLFIAAIYGIIVFLVLPISGALLNPALSIVQYFNGKLGYREAIIYTVIQVLAAISSYYTVAALA
jgi:glycerol uptake facilitator-like aquaporin